MLKYAVAMLEPKPVAPAAAPSMTVIDEAGPVSQEMFEKLAAIPPKDLIVATLYFRVQHNRKPYLEKVGEGQRVPRDAAWIKVPVVNLVSTMVGKPGVKFLQFDRVQSEILDGLGEAMFVKDMGYSELSAV